jgi:hypothetical protein
MKRILLATIVAAALNLSGCVTTHYSKRIAVHKDAQGNVTNTIVTEEVVQPGRSAPPLDFQYLKLSGD